MFESLYRELQLRANLLTESDDFAAPVFAKSIDQLEVETSRLNDQIRPTQELQAKAHYFLTNSGINTHNILKPLNTSNYFEEIQEDRYVDMEKFLQEAHEIMIIEAIENRRNENDDEFDAFYERQMHQILDSRNTLIQQDKESKSQYKDFGAEDNAVSLNMLNQYYEAVSDINKHRIQNNVCDVIGLLSKIKNPTGLDISQKSVQRAWTALKHIATSNAKITGEGYYLQSYISQPYDSLEAVEARRKLIHASKSWLEKQYHTHMEDKLIKNAHTHHVGGIPSVHHRVKKYIEMEYQNNHGDYIDRRLEIVDDVPIWLFLFLLIRSGHWNTADTFIQDSPEMFRDQGDFITYYNEYRNAPNHCLSKANQERILNDYYQLVYGDGMECDPYKQIVYKVIGRCELHRMTLPIDSSQDDIWLQMSLIREVTETERFEYERYRLIDLQNEVMENKDKWYIDDDAQWAYLTVLILTHQFEKAVEHLYNIKNLHVEAVHFAIALSYYGLLHISSSETASRIITDNKNKQLSLNFGRLIHQYVHVFLYDRPKETLQYIYLLSLYSSRHGYTSDEMVDLCRSYMTTLVLRSIDFKSTLVYLIGDNSVLVSLQLTLAGVDSKNDCIQHILFPLAESCVQMGRCEDAVYTYALSQDYNKVFDVLIKQLSDALQTPQSTRETNPTLSKLSNNDIIHFSNSIINSYSSLMSMIDANKQTTVHILVELVKFRVLYESMEYRQALQVVTGTGVFPLGDHGTQQTVDRCVGLNEGILRNLPELLLNVMDTLYKLWVEFSKHPSMNNTTLSDIETSVRNILVFVGIIPFSMPMEIVQRLNQVEMQMVEQKTF
ncbi:NIC-domain-containing protein [Backusella circina FSU 941]|nr:NIC-domain-containing protein [Backusella circina FSU 941]